MAATCMAVCKGSRKKIRGIFISSCHLPAAVECDIVILSEPGLNPTGSSWAVLRTQLIPARGRKRGGSSRPWPSCPGHNLSPRGDGNSGATHIGLWRKRHNLSPRGDGNLWPVAVPQLIPRDTTYPREGTETKSLHLRQIKPSDTTYPREGTETLLDKLPSEGTTTQLIPARGRKL